MSASLAASYLSPPNNPLDASMTCMNDAANSVAVHHHHYAPSDTSTHLVYLNNLHETRTQHAAVQRGNGCSLKPHDPFVEGNLTPAVCSAEDESTSNTHRSNPPHAVGDTETQVSSSQEPEGAVEFSEKTPLHEEDVHERLWSVMKEREEEDSSVHPCRVRKNEDSSEQALLTKSDVSCETLLEFSNGEEKEYDTTENLITTDYSMTEAGFPPSTGHLSSNKDSEMSLLMKTVDELHTKLQHLESECCMYKDMAHSMKGNIRAFCRILPVNDIKEDDIFLKVMSKTQLQVWQQPSASMEERRRQASKTMTLPVDHRPTRSAGNLKNKCIPATPRTARSSWCASMTIPAKLPQTNSWPPTSFPARPNPKVFFFDHIFSQHATDKEVNDVVMEEILTAWDGMPVTIVAYGVTGTGKTHTINSIAERAISEFDRRAEIAKKSGEEVTFRVTLLEVYNEQIRDLLGDPLARLKVVGSDSPRAGSAVEWTVDPHNVGTELRRALDLGRSNRSTSVTNIHQHSSRSHLLLTVKVQIKSQETIVKSGKLTLVDLAGSERLKRSEAEGERLVETKHINKSLSALGDVIWAYERKVRFIPFRNSKLTHLLQSSLGLENSRTVVIVTCSPNITHANETLNSLQFGAKVNSITIPSNSSVLASSAAHSFLKSQAQEERKHRELLERQVTELKFVLNKERKNYLPATDTPKSHAGGSGFTRKLVTTAQAKVVNKRVSPTKTSDSPTVALSARHSIGGYPLDHGMKVSSNDKGARAPRAQSVEQVPIVRLQSNHKEYSVDLYSKLALAKDQIRKLQRKLDQKTSDLNTANRELHNLRCISAVSNHRPTLKDSTKDWAPVLSSRRISTSNTSVLENSADDLVASTQRTIRNIEYPQSNSRSGPLRFTFRPISRQKTDGHARSKPPHGDRMNERLWDTPRDPPRPHPVLTNLDLPSSSPAPYDVANTIDRLAKPSPISSEDESSSVSTQQIPRQVESPPGELTCADASNDGVASGTDVEMTGASNHSSSAPVPPLVATPEAPIEPPALLPEVPLGTSESATSSEYVIPANDESACASTHSNTCEVVTPSKCADRVNCEPDGAITAQKDTCVSKTPSEATMGRNGDSDSAIVANSDTSEFKTLSEAVMLSAKIESRRLTAPPECTIPTKTNFVVEEISHNDFQRIVGQERAGTSLEPQDMVSPALLLRPVHDGATGDGILEWPLHSPISLSSTGSEIKERLGKMLPVRTSMPEQKSSASSKAGPSPRCKGPSARSTTYESRRNSSPLHGADYRRALTPRRYSGTSPRTDSRPRWR
eukprot:GEMP01000285.1.p1 GENE.GEMP01000285.1~~GEMP01000285.1.p1  ORF type:complete len:1299 (+),score=295.96 GEMP01000285.1:2594-6490(+)